MAVVPTRVRPGQAARVHVTFRPSAAHKAHWNNESTPLRVWVAGAEGWTIATRLLEAPQGDQPESDEVRRLDFEVKAPPTADGKTRLAAYALYNTCEEAGGRCLFLRQDLTIESTLRNDTPLALSLTDVIPIFRPSRNQIMSLISSPFRSMMLVGSLALFAWTDVVAQGKAKPAPEEHTGLRVGERRPGSRSRINKARNALLMSC